VAVRERLGIAKSRYYREHARALEAVAAALAERVRPAAGEEAPRPAPPGAARRRPQAVSRCVTPAAVATFAAWPAAAAGAADEDELRGQRHPEALPVPAEFRAFQTCRQRWGD
jgi:hypothetical protein